MSLFKKISFAMVTSLVCASVGFASVNASGKVTCPSGSKRAGSSVTTFAECNIDAPSQGNDLMSRLNVIINVALGLIGLVAVIMIIVGGFQYTTSSGDPSKATKAKNTIMYGIIGLVIALLAYAIVNFVLTSVFGSK